MTTNTDAEENEDVATDGDALSEAEIDAIKKERDDPRRAAVPPEEAN